MTKSNVYTKTGDSGETSLFTGERVKKNHHFVDFYGEIDELNAHIGLCISLIHQEDYKTYDFLIEVQKQLFVFGNIIAFGEKRDAKAESRVPSLEKEIVRAIELEIDRLDSELPALKSFILPSGSNSIAITHVCRTICRRVERKGVCLLETFTDNKFKIILKYLNRLSDYFFILGRYQAQKEQVKEITWP